MHVILRERMAQLTQHGYTIEADDKRFAKPADWLDIIDQHVGIAIAAFGEVEEGTGPPDDIRQGFVILGALSMAAIEWVNRRQMREAGARPNT
jgi:hypothetical protein